MADMVCATRSLPAGDPLRVVAERTPDWRLKKTTNWRDTGRRALAMAGVADAPVEERLHQILPPWTDQENVHISLDAGHGARREAPDAVRRAAAEELLATLPAQATWVWSDGSAEGGVTNGGGGALIILPTGEEHEVRVPAGMVCSSTRAELVAIEAALEQLLQFEGDLAAGPVVLCTDSQAALALLASGAGAQITTLGASIWRKLLSITGRGQEVRLQWVPAHCGLPGNERADTLAKEASDLPQADAPVDVRSLTKAVSRAATRAWQRSWPPDFFKRIFGDRLPAPVLGEDRDAAVNVHQLRAAPCGTCTGSAGTRRRSAPVATGGRPVAEPLSARCAGRRLTCRSTCCSVAVASMVLISGSSTRSIHRGLNG